MAIQMAGWTICLPGELIARQYDNLRRIEVTGDIPDGYSWDLLLCCGNLYDAIPLQAASGGLSATLTAAQCSEFGPYYIQLRGAEPGGAVRHTNVVPAIVPRSVSGTESWPTIPSEFEALEARIRDIASHPPIPGEDGKWQIWDPDAGKYVPSDFPLPEGSGGESYVVNVWAYNAKADDTGTGLTASAAYDAPREQIYQGIKAAIASGSPVYANVIITDKTSAEEAVKVSPDGGQRIALTTAYDTDGVIGYYFAGNYGGNSAANQGLWCLIGSDHNGTIADAIETGARITKDGVYAILEEFAGRIMSLSITGASVGQIAQITAVDASGAPTAWKAVNGLPEPSPSDDGKVLSVQQIGELDYGYGFAHMPNINDFVPLGITDASPGKLAQVRFVDDLGQPTMWEAVDMPSGGGKPWTLLQDVMVTADIDKQTSGVTYIVGDNGVWAIVFDKDANGAAFAVGELHIFGILVGSANSSLIVLSSEASDNVAVASYRNALGTSYAVYQIRITQVGGKWVTDHADKCTQYANQVTPLAPTAMSNNGAFVGDMSKLLMIPNAVTLSKICIASASAQLGMSGRLLIYGR